ncbi:outer membrane porin OpcP [Caballeronia calidae]|uniref:Outer membrane porin OpcP n=1 Tax=Caballeronia calidae TaxID=1777139 RepID=A0A158DV51_9BURK|nr:porin [Caballeronia calidae]SAK98458.1 outer membrane porin OpcP [Caballeronia calidae]
MDKRIFGIAAMSLFAGAAHAQSSVTLFGIVDEGINYISNDHGHSNWTNTSGVLQGSRWGLKGAEDVGGGLKVVFWLESGFSAANGSLALNRMWARQSWVGLSSANYGTLTFGRQYESIVDYVQPVNSGNVYIGVGHPFDNDDLINSFHINNSVKYASPDFRGFTFGGLYGFGNAATNADGSGSGFGSNRAWSLGTAYQNGGFQFGAGYFRLSTPNENAVGAIQGDYLNLSTTSALGPLGLTTPVKRQENIAAGVSYKVNAVKLSFVYSHSRFDTNNDSLKFSNYDVNVGYFFRPDIFFGGSYVFTDGNLKASGAEPKYHQLGLIADYFLSKRTDLYLLGVYQHAAGDAPVASIAPDSYGPGGTSAPDASTSKNQTLVRIGMRHKF